MSTTFDERNISRDGVGRFATKTNSVADGVTLVADKRHKHRTYFQNLDEGLQDFGFDMERRELVEDLVDTEELEYDDVYTPRSGGYVALVKDDRIACYVAQSYISFVAGERGGEQREACYYTFENHRERKGGDRGGVEYGDVCEGCNYTRPLTGICDSGCDDD